MHDFTTVFPDPEILLALQPEELGKMLFLLRSRRLNQRVDSFHLANLCQELWPASYQGQQPLPRREPTRDQPCCAEAWEWLEAQGLIVSVPDLNGSNGWRCLSRRAQKFEDETDFVKFAIARLLPRAILHPRIVTTVWLAFMRGEFDVAVFQAMKTVEVAVREASGLSDGSYGVALMREAFDMKSGPLTDQEVEKGEREARSSLFAGAIGSYKNPQSHQMFSSMTPQRRWRSS